MKYHLFTDYSRYESSLQYIRSFETLEKTIEAFKQDHTSDDIGEIYISVESGLSHVMSLYRDTMDRTKIQEFKHE